MPTYLCQFDPRWANIRIGDAKFTLGQKGCAATALCMAFYAFGFPINPNELAIHPELFTRNGHAQGPGLIIWKEVEKWMKSRYPQNIFSITRYYGQNDFAIRQNLVPGAGVLLRVANGSHWVKADRKMLLRNDYNCRDPWKGKGCAARGDYGDIDGYVIVKIT